MALKGGEGLMALQLVEELFRGFPKAKVVANLAVPESPWHLLWKLGGT